MFTGLLQGFKRGRKEIKGFVGKKGTEETDPLFWDEKGNLSSAISSNYLMKRKEEGPTMVEMHLFEERDHCCTQDYAPTYPTHPPNHPINHQLSTAPASPTNQPTCQSAVFPA